MSAQEKEMAFNQLQGLEPQALTAEACQYPLAEPHRPFFLQPSACFLASAVGSRRGTTPPPLTQQVL